MRTLLTLDPGMGHPACAVFKDGRLVDCMRIAGSLDTTADPAMRSCVVADGVMAWFSARDFDLLDEVAMELPQFYSRKKSKGDPNKLALLVLVCGAVAARMRTEYGCAITCYHPGEWAGQLPKSTKRGEALTSPRGLRVVSKLSDAERGALADDHDSVDSVGIGLHHLGRFAPVRVFPGALPG